MADKPILFSGPMIRAILDGRKSQTRRVLKPQPFPVGGPFYRPFPKIAPREWHSVARSGYIANIQTVLYAPGDRLWVREAWHAARSLDRTPPRDIPRDADIEHAATARSYAEIGLKGRLRPGMFMPRWASRLTLIVTDVRVQRLRDISNEDCIAEGIPVHPNRNASRTGPVQDQFSRDVGLLSHYGARFRELWDSLNESRGYGWEANPWVCAVTFTTHRQNIDSMGPV